MNGCDCVPSNRNAGLRPSCAYEFDFVVEGRTKKGSEYVKYGQKSSLAERIPSGPDLIHVGW